MAEDMSVCPHCGSHYTERYSGDDRENGVLVCVTYHCFWCNRDFDVYLNPPEENDEATEQAAQ